MDAHILILGFTIPFYFSFYDLQSDLRFAYCVSINYVMVQNLLVRQEFITSLFLYKKLSTKLLITEVVGWPKKSLKWWKYWVSYPPLNMLLTIPHLLRVIFPKLGSSITHSLGKSIGTQMIDQLFQS